MNVTGEELGRALAGVARLALFDRAAGQGFGKDRAACARSFWAYGLALPAIGLLLSLDVLATDAANPTIMAIADGLATVIELAGFPLLLIPVLRLYGRAERWAWFVTGYNWFNAAQMMLMVAVFSLCAGPLAPLGMWPVRGAQLYLLVLEAFLAEAILDIGGVKAAGIVLLDVFVTVVIDGTAHWIGTGSFSL